MSHTDVGKIKSLINYVQYYETVRKLCWLKTIQCLFYYSQNGIELGYDKKEADRQCNGCKVCENRFDDLNDTIFAGNHQPLKI